MRYILNLIFQQSWILDEIDHLYFSLFGLHNENCKRGPTWNNLCFYSTNNCISQLSDGMYSPLLNIYTAFF